ncbi:T9SS type A sorting domain-containing protein, partial [candidate division WOR-3 bacterium]|nr:T9SS type A sorting domain-containing protein [candidate division WOR-3 bacterium]
NRSYWALQNIIVPVQGFLKFSWRFGSDSTISAEGYFFDDVSVRLFSGTGVEEDGSQLIIEEHLTKILSFYPNPTAGRFFIKYSLASRTRAEILVFDLSGRKIADLVDSEREKGTYIAQWEGRDKRGELVPAGTYFFLFRAGGASEMGKFILIR